MKKKYAALILFITASGFAQKLHHQTLASQGMTHTSSNGLMVSQSIGQQSVIGNYTVNGKNYGQGFQQSNWRKYIQSDSNSTITTTTFPLPFVDEVHFQFSAPVEGPINISIFDIRGRLIFTDVKTAENNLLTVSLIQLAASNYLVQLKGKNYTYYTQILKAK